MVSEIWNLESELLLVVCSAARQISIPKASQQFHEILNDIATQNSRLQIILQWTLRGLDVWM